ncbi:gamma-glutamyltransferase [Escherichia coli]
MAPAKATRDMFLDDGQPRRQKITHFRIWLRHTGTVAGFSLALDKYGTMSLNKVVHPAFKLARDGFIV